ncbi:MAG: hypothetical protein Q9179_002566 [Wetmoreana sp. 5 TL-2023]
MVLPRKLILPPIIQWIKLVAPMPIEVKPFRRGFRTPARRSQHIARVVVSVGVGIQHRIPQGPAVRFVMQEAEREDVRMAAGRRIHSVRTHCTVHHRPLPQFLNSGIGIRLTEIMLGDEDVGWFSGVGVETDEGVFPVADVVAEADVEDEVAEVVAVEEEPECVGYVVGFVH